MKPMDPKRNKGLADFLRACASYAWVEFGPKGMLSQKIENNEKCSYKLLCHYTRIVIIRYRVIVFF